MFYAPKYMFQHKYVLIAALGMPRSEYNDSSKRHTMSHPPDNIPEIDNDKLGKLSPAKSKIKEKVKDKV